MLTRYWSITTWSTLASLQIKGLATKYTTVKWPIGSIQKAKTTCVRVLHGISEGHYEI